MSSERLVRARISLVTGLLGTLFVLGVASAFALVAGTSPARFFTELLRGTLLSPYGIGQTLFKATPLIFTGLAVALPLRAGLFNIGAEGQLIVGAFAAAWVGVVASPLPGVVVALVAVFAAFLCGAAWGGIAGAMKRRFGAHEVITTIMLNFVAAALTGYVVTYHFAVPETIHTPAVDAGAWLPKLGEMWPAARGSTANLAFPVALCVALTVGGLLWRSVPGFELRAVGLGARAAEAGGIVAGRTHLAALAIGGGCAGLVGVNEVLGYRHYFQTDFSEGWGFMGIAVALLGRNHPAGVVMAALLFGALSHGGLVVNHLVPREIVGVIQAVVILTVLAGRFAAHRWHLAVQKTERAVT